MKARSGRFSRSIRFRLAAWYAAIVLLVILAMGVAFSVLLERELRSDVDARIERTARTIKDEFDVFQDPSTGQLVGFPPPPALYTFPSLLIQVVDADGNIVLSSENLNERRLPTGETQLGSAEPVFSTETLEGAQIRAIRLPLVVRSTRETVGAIHVGEPLIQIDQTLDHVRRLLAVGAVIAVAFAAAIGWFLAGRALRPVDRITATARDIAEGAGVSTALAARLPVGRAGDELDRLSVTFNQMLDRLQETFEGQRRFVADASHELRTPLTAIRGNVDVIARQVERGVPPSELTDGLSDLRRESERMSRLIEDLLLLAKTESAALETSRLARVSLDDVAAEVAKLGRALSTGQQIELDAPGGIELLADRDRLVQVGLILVENAIRHTAAGGTVRVAVSRSDADACLSVSDNGPGIPVEHIDRIFDRFYRIDSSRHRGSGGTGLGLSIAKAIVESHGGNLAVTSREGSGTTFTARFPMRQATDGRRIPEVQESRVT